MFSLPKEPLPSRGDRSLPTRLPADLSISRVAPRRSLFTPVDTSNGYAIPVEDTTIGTSFPRLSLTSEPTVQTQPPSAPTSSYSSSNFTTPSARFTEPPIFFINSKESREKSSLKDITGDQKEFHTTHESPVAGQKRGSEDDVSFERRVNFKPSTESIERVLATKSAEASVSTSGTNDKTSEATTSSQTKAQEQEPDRQEKATIVVFGFEPHTKDAVLNHFAKYGTVAEHTQTAESQLSIRYNSPESAQSALASNGVLICDYMVGVMGKVRSTEYSSFPRRSGLIPLEESKNLFKDNTGLGSGKAGLSVLNLPNVSPAGTIRLIRDSGFLSKVKSFIFEW